MEYKNTRTKYHTPAEIEAEARLLFDRIEHAKELQRVFGSKDKRRWEEVVDAAHHKLALFNLEHGTHICRRDGAVVFRFTDEHARKRRQVAAYEGRTREAA